MARAYLRLFRGAKAELRVCRGVEVDGRGWRRLPVDPSGRSSVRRWSRRCARRWSTSSARPARDGSACTAHVEGVGDRSARRRRRQDRHGREHDRDSRARLGEVRNASFVGFLPVEAPRWLAVCVLQKDDSARFYGGSYAAPPVVRLLLQCQQAGTAAAAAPGIAGRFERSGSKCIWSAPGDSGWGRGLQRQRR
jgi:hypothetical protein